MLIGIDLGSRSIKLAAVVHGVLRDYVTQESGRPPPAGLCHADGLIPAAGSSPPATAGTWPRNTLPKMQSPKSSPIAWGQAFLS